MSPQLIEYATDLLMWIGLGVGVFVFFVGIDMKFHRNADYRRCWIVTPLLMCGAGMVLVTFGALTWKALAI